jgi:hypothetical protein
MKLTVTVWRTRSETAWYASPVIYRDFTALSSILPTVINWSERCENGDTEVTSYRFISRHEFGSDANRKMERISS